jgi:hypothetical protein
MGAPQPVHPLPEIVAEGEVGTGSKVPLTHRGRKIPLRGDHFCGHYTHGCCEPGREPSDAPGRLGGGLGPTDLGINDVETR